MSSGESKSRRTPSGETIAILFFEAITSRTRKVIICILGGHLRKLACITGVILSRLSGEERRARNARRGICVFPAYYAGYGRFSLSSKRFRAV